MRFAGLRIIRCAKQDALRSFSEGGPVYDVYLIESLCMQGEHYLGTTTDLKQRLREHDQGKSSHTAKFSPWKLITYVAFTDRAKAEAVEHYLKSGSVTHSLESAYGNSLLEVFRVLVFNFLKSLACCLDLAVR